MKKRIGLLCTTLLLAILLPATALAASGFEDARLNFVTDEAGLLTNNEWAALEGRAEEISQRQRCGVYIILLDDFTRYTYDSSVDEAAKSFYTDYALGYGPQKSGVLLLLSMAERDYALIAYGYGNTAFTDYGKDRLADVFLDNFGDDDWVGGLTDYLNKCDSMLAAARDGRPLDLDSDPKVVFGGIAFSLALGLGTAFLICLAMKASMKSVKAKTEAGSYLVAGSLAITVREDRFTHTTESRRKIERESSGGSSGGSFGGTTIDSSGFSSKSGKF